MRIDRVPAWVAVALWAIAGSMHAVGPPADARRQEAVHERGAHVMPFALERTQHVFETTADGGVQRVLARADGEVEIPAIRAHLADITQRFRARDFSGPAQIHGVEMPGLSTLQAASADALTVEYRELPQGAEVRYRGHDPQTIAAIHAWFAAQLSDHGHDATGHAHHHAPASAASSD